MQIGLIHKILNPFRKLPEGYFRLYLIGWIFIPAIILFKVSGNGEGLYYKPLNIFVAYIFFLFAYYVIGRMIVWVYDGFKENIKVDSPEPREVDDFKPNDHHFSLAISGLNLIGVTIMSNPPTTPATEADWLTANFKLYKTTLNWPYGRTPIARSNLIEGSLQRHFYDTYSQILSRNPHILNNKKKTLSFPVASIESTDAVIHGRHKTQPDGLGCCLGFSIVAVFFLFMIVSSIVSDPGLIWVFGAMLLFVIVSNLIFGKRRNT